MDAKSLSRGGTEAVYSPEQSEWLRAVQALKKRRPRPSWADVLAAAVALGYRRVEPVGAEYERLVRRGRLAV